MTHSVDKMKTSITILAFLIAIGAMAQVPSPIEQTYNRIAIQHGMAHIGTGEYIDNSSIGIVDGKIIFVKNALTNPIVEEEWDTIIDISGKHVYPGFIAANVTLGITEIDQVAATHDYDETGMMNPHVRTMIGWNTDSQIIYTVRTNGVLAAQSTPRGGILSGTSSVMALDGWNWEDAAYKIDDGIHLNWPSKVYMTGWWAEPGSSVKNDNYEKTKQIIWNYFKEAQAYSRKSKPSETNLKFEALRGLFKGNKRLYIHADYAPEINDVIDFSREFNLKFPVIVGGYDSHMLSNRLKENHFTVIIQRPTSLPEFDDDYIQSYYELASKLQTKGVMYCISGSGRMEAMNTRNLPFWAGITRAYGLTEEEAVASITLNAAKILGLDDKIGSLEKGKDATLYVSEGNALETVSNEAYMAMVKGRFIVLENHQMKLNEKYLEKYGF
jgi:imidazolonepropionase-like amidohydrolase